MFVIPVVCFVAGLAAMGRTKPQSTVRKMLCLGPRSGLIYNVEQLPETATFIVRAPGGRAIAQFLHASVRQPGKPGLIYQHGQGDPQLLELLRRDFGIEPQKPAAVTTPAEGSGAKVQGSDQPSETKPAAAAPRTGRSTP